MTKGERIAVIRVFNDLIMADAVIDSAEMYYYQKLRNEFRFSTEEEKQARNLTFADALGILEKSDVDLRKKVIAHCYDLAVKDGFCSRTEAIIIASVVEMLSDNAHSGSEVISIPRHLLNIPDLTVIFIELQPSNDIDSILADNYRHLFSEFRLAGFDYIYIPHVIKHYQESSKELVEQIVSFVSPGLSPEGTDATITRLLSMDTCEFTKDILCNKLGMSMLRNTEPSLLFKIGSSYVVDMIYSNYLRVTLDHDCMTHIDDMLDRFMSMLNADILVIGNNKEQRNQFLYSGFYKLLLDAHLLRHNVRTRIFINSYKEEIYFPDIDSKLMGLHRREKALYLLLLIKSQDGGINFTQPTTQSQLSSYNKRMKELQDLYGKIYSKFGGDADKAPDLLQPEIRRPMMSLIKRQISKYSNEINNIADYLIEKDKYGRYIVGLDPDMVFVRDYTTGRMLDLRSWIKNFL